MTMRNAGWSAVCVAGLLVVGCGPKPDGDDLNKSSSSSGGGSSSLEASSQQQVSSSSSTGGASSNAASTGGSGSSAVVVTSSTSAGASSASANASSTASATSSSSSSGGLSQGSSAGTSGASTGGSSSSVMTGSSSAAASSSSGSACAAEQACHDATGGDICCPNRTRCCSASQLGIPVDQCILNEDPCPLPCPGVEAACPVGDYCQTNLDGDTRCVDQCPASRRCGFNGCCQPGAACVADACVAGDLTVDATALAQTLVVEQRDVQNCDARDGCAGGEGVRKLARFELVLRNTGTQDVVVGRTQDTGIHQPATCSTAPSLVGFVGWRILDGTTVVASGSMAGGCIRDANAAGAYGSCAFQGVTAGGASANAMLPTCNFVDLTNVAPGDYQFELTANAAGQVMEANPANNTVTVPLTVPGNCVGGRVCGATACCPDSALCTNGACQLPDLIIDADLLAQTAAMDSQTFSNNDCAILEGCIRAGGERRLLRFSTSTPNVGNADFFVGDPQSNPNAEFSQCHGHYHYHEYAHYRLLDANGVEVVRGAKQAFCLLDVQQYVPGSPPARYSCGFQGITAGWADIYTSGLDCQWIDVTGVAEGDYTLELEVNPRRIIAESDYTNNIARTQVHITRDPNQCVPQPEVCWDGIDQNCDNVPDDGCQPIVGNTSCANAVQTTSNLVAPVQLQMPSAANAVTLGCGGAGGQAVFVVNLPFDQLAYISTHGSTVDTVLGVMGNSCATQVACVDDTCLSQQGHWSGMLSAGANYIVVRAKDPVEALAQFKVELAGCNTARPLPGNGAHIGNTNTGSNQKSASCRLGGQGAGGPDELWYFTTCPGSSRAEFSTCTAPTGTQPFDTVLEVQQGACRGNPVAGACNDDDDVNCPGQGFASHMVSDLQGSGAGDGMWFLLVEAYSTNNAGPYTLTASVTPQ